MAQSSEELKAEILSELRADRSGAGRATLYLNVGLLVLLGFAVGILVGRGYERNLHKAMARRPPPMAALPAGASDAPLPADHPPVEGAGGMDSAAAMDAMAPILALRARLEENPEDLEALVEMGNLNFQIQRYEASVQYYQRALALEPTNPDVITDMGIAMRRLGRFDEALEAFDLAASLDATHMQSRFNRGIIFLMDKGDLPAAIEAFEAYLSLGPNVPQRREVMQQIEQLRREVQGEARLHGPEPATAPDVS